MRHEIRIEEVGTQTKVIHIHSLFNIEKSMILDFPYFQIKNSMEEWQNGSLVQVAFPYLSPDEREFLITGLTPSEWDEMFRRK